MDAVESCGEKCANLCQVYKLIMVSRVPGYGHLEYLVFELLIDLITLRNGFVGYYYYYYYLIIFGIELGIHSQ